MKLQLVKNDVLRLCLQGGHGVKSPIRLWISYSTTKSLSLPKILFIIIPLFSTNDAVIQINLCSLRRTRLSCLTHATMPGGEGWAGTLGSTETCSFVASRDFGLQKESGSNSAESQ